MHSHRIKDSRQISLLTMAAQLSLIAGIVNITSLIFANTLVSNITGHFSLFSEETSLHHYARAGMYLLYILCFLAGAFICNLLLQKTTKPRNNTRLFFPILLELLLLLIIIEQRRLLPLPPHYAGLISPCIMLLAMGVQNALVTIVSSSAIRTTHLTGLFTDLGIEMSQWLFEPKQSLRKPLQRKMLLKAIIIGGFFIGGVLGGSCYSALHVKTLYIAVGILAFMLLQEQLKNRKSACTRATDTGND